MAGFAQRRRPRPAGSGPSGDARPEDATSRDGSSEGVGARGLGAGNATARSRAGSGGGDPPADPESAARGVCLDLLTTRPRSRAELATDLARRDVPDDVAARVLDRLIEVGLVDDAAFAEQWVDSRHRHRGLGRRALADELRRKGVDTETAGVALAEIGRDEEYARGRELVDRRMRSMVRFDDAVAARRLVGMLARKGYGSGLAYEVVREALAVRGTELEELEVLPD